MPDVDFSTIDGRFSNEPAPDAINEMLGRDVGEWLQEALQQADLEHDFIGEVIAEDYGYGFWLNIDEVPYWVMMTQLYPASPPDEPQPRWLISVEARLGCVWFFRKPPKPVHIPEIMRVIHQALVDDDAISDVQWWTRSYGTGEPLPTPPSTRS
ncbi:MAG: hypothetical protein AAF125_11305 [Chloroflexota bacterium]